MSQHKNVALLLTGNELMSGDTVDSNSSRIALALGERQIAVSKKITVGDDPALLRASLRSFAERQASSLSTADLVRPKTI